MTIVLFFFDILSINLNCFLIEDESLAELAKVVLEKKVASYEELNIDKLKEFIARW